MMGSAQRRALPLLLLACLFFVLAAPDEARSHARSTSWSSTWVEGREARIVVRVPQLELTRLPYGIVQPPLLEPALADYVASRIRLFAADQPCSVIAPPRALRAPAERAAIEWQVRCPDEGRLRLESRFLQDVAPTHLHFARVRADGAPPDERVLTEETPSWSLASPGSGEDAEAGSPLSQLSTYLALGVEHILGGIDHLVFLLGLLLIASRLGEVVRIVTGFTVAHSLTLALAAFGTVRPDTAAVEALIGLSIVIVAVENGWLLAGRPRALIATAAVALVALAGLAAAGVGAVPAAAFAGLALFTVCYLLLVERSERPARLRFAIALAFGLVHGFGFAGVLAEFELPRERLVPALLGFNLGVEAGQLALVAVAWPLLRLIARRPTLSRLWVEAASAVVCAAGVFWLVTRTYG